MNDWPVYEKEWPAWVIVLICLFALLLGLCIVIGFFFAIYMGFAYALGALAGAFFAAFEHVSHML